MHVRSLAAAAHTAVEMEPETARRMAEAATTFFAPLRAEQRARVMFPYSAVTTVSGEHS